MNTIKNTLVENLATQGQEKLSINGIKDKYIRENMKKLMENQIRQDVGSALNEDFTMGVGAPLGADQGIPHGGDSKAVFAPISLALVRQRAGRSIKSINIGLILFSSNNIDSLSFLWYAKILCVKDFPRDFIIESFQMLQYRG